MNAAEWIVGALSVVAVQSSWRALAALPDLEPAFSPIQIEKSAPSLDWTKCADGSEKTVLQESVAGSDLAGVSFVRRKTVGDGWCEVCYTLENTTDQLRYASFGWRTVFSLCDAGDRNWFPTTENVIDLTMQASFWGYYTKPGPWQFALVEPWFAAYNAERQTGCAFLFDFNTLSAAYGSADMRTRGVLFDGGMLPPGRSITVKTLVRELKGLPSLATVTKDFAAGFAGPPTAPVLTVLPFRDIAVAGQAAQLDVNGKVLGRAKVDAVLTAGVAQDVATVSSEKPGTQTVLAAMLNGVSFEYFRENGFRMASLPMVAPVWPHVRKMPAKTLDDSVVVRQKAKAKALLVFGFYANFFRFERMFPELAFTVISGTPQGMMTLPPASTIGEYKYVFLGNVNEECIRPMLSRLSAYVRNGGTLVVGGGPFSYGCGGYTGTFIEKMLPVETHPFDCLPAAADDPDGRTAVQFDRGDAKVLWIQRVSVKHGAETLLRTVRGDPLLVRGRYGKGLVYALLVAPIGSGKRDEKVFWLDGCDYVGTMRGLLTGEVQE